MLPIAGAGPASSQETRTQSRSPIQVAGTQIFEPSLAASHGECPLAGSGIGSGVRIKTRPSSLNVGIPSIVLTTVPNTCLGLYFLYVQDRLSSTKKRVLPVSLS